MACTLVVQHVKAFVMGRGVTDLDVLNATRLSRIKTPSLQDPTAIWRNGNSGTIFVLEFRSFENLLLRTIISIECYIL